MGLVFWIKARGKTNFFIGFLTGIAWFWWMALSFRYYDLTWAIPLVILIIGCGYGLIFYVLDLFKNSWVKGVLVGGFFLVVHPFGFSWFRPDLIFVNSLFHSDWIAYSLVILSAILITQWRQIPLIAKVFIPVLLILATLTPIAPLSPEPPMKIVLTNTHIPQEKLWNSSYRFSVINQSLTLIDDAIMQKGRLVILPESAFPIPLNLDTNLTSILKEKSEKIAIAAGSIEIDLQTQAIYNTAYYFDHGVMTIARKHILVPFGEAIPLPSPFDRWINDLVFGGASDYTTAATMTTIKIDSTPLRNAICYEATEESMFDHASWMVAMSNNGWFTPSPEPTLQHLLMKLLSNRYGTRIYHAVNGSPSYQLP